MRSKAARSDAGKEIALDFHEIEGGKLQARCRRCLRGSPALGHTRSEAEERVMNLGWTVDGGGWSCPICLGRERRGRAPRPGAEGVDRGAE
jgi:hypothetical protein